MDATTQLSDRLSRAAAQLRSRLANGEDLADLIHELECIHADAVYVDLCGIQIPIRAIDLISESILAVEEHCEANERALACPGRPRFDIRSEQLSHLIELGFTSVDMATILGVSRSTVARRLREFGLGMERKYCVISDQDLDDIVLNIIRQYPECGQKMMQGHLKERGIVVQQSRVRESMRRTDPHGTKQRLKTAIRRRQYNVGFPMELWHQDGNHKLVRWRIVIHGAIDGYSRLPVYLKCSTNNRADTVLGYFVEAVRAYGLPLRVRTDRGGENFDVAQYMWTQPGRGPETNSIIMGRSVHNQRIERLWRDVYQGCLCLFYRLFYHLEDIGVLNPCCELHLFALHFVFVPRIQRSLDHFCNAYIHHPLSSCHNRSPAQLFYTGAQHAIDQNRRIADQVCQLSMATYGVDLDAPPSSSPDSTVVVPQVTVEDEERCLESLEDIDPLSPACDEDHGIGCYIDCIEALTM